LGQEKGRGTDGITELTEWDGRTEGRQDRIKEINQIFEKVPRTTPSLIWSFGPASLPYLVNPVILSNSPCLPPFRKRTGS
jgi:hypothetical protein